MPEDICVIPVTGGFLECVTVLIFHLQHNGVTTIYAEHRSVLLKQTGKAGRKHSVQARFRIQARQNMPRLNFMDHAAASAAKLLKDGQWALLLWQHSACLSR